MEISALDGTNIKGLTDEIGQKIFDYRRIIVSQLMQKCRYINYFFLVVGRVRRNIRHIQTVAGQGSKSRQKKIQMVSLLTADLQELEG